MSEAGNVEDVKKQELHDDDDSAKNEVDCGNSGGDLKESDKNQNDENSMPSSQLEVIILHHYCYYSYC